MLVTIHSNLCPASYPLKNNCIGKQIYKTHANHHEAWAQFMLGKQSWCPFPFHNV